MGTELVRPRIKEEILETQSVPPGFESIASFTLKRVREKDTLTTISDSASVSESETLIKNNDLENDDEIIARSLKRRSWINYTPSDENSGDESDTEQSRSHKSCLPKGVIRGCSECFDCQKVIARWRPEEACRPDLGSVPVFYPSEEEFEDTLNYIASIRAHAEKFGICRIVPPSTWKPPCPLKDKKIWEGANFSTRIQRVDKLQNRDSVKRMSNIDENTNNRRSMDFDNENNSVSWNVGPGVEEGFGFEPGPEFTLDTFQKYANDFKLQYFRKKESVLDIENKNSKMEEQWDPEVEDIEGEYWRMVESPSAEIEVLYGADLETGIFGSGFPKSCNRGGSVENEKYVNSGWNLNNLPRLSGSVLSYESADISGVLVPWLYVGMCFSSFCWHVEDHHLYSMNYMHWGSPKIWYGVPAENALKLEESMKKHLPELFYEQPDLLHKLVTQLSPSILKADGVPVYRCVQNPGEFVLTFPRAYHSGFNCGFNCAEAVNVAPVDWLPYGQNAIELYREQGRKTSISHDKLLLGAARAAVKAQWEINLLRRNTPDNLRWKVVCGKDGLLSKAFKHRVETEHGRVQFLWNFSKPIKMEKDFDSTSEKECAVCFFDLHLFAVGCHCSPNRYTCLYHTKQLCSCPWSVKSCLYRYNVDELNVFAEALEGKLSAIHKWAKEDLGLVLSSYISKDKGLIGDSSHSLERPEIGEMCQQPAISSLENMAGKEGSEGKTKEMSCQHATVIEKPRVASHNMGTSQITKVKDESEVKKSSYQIKDNIILLSDDEGEEVSASGSVSVSASNKDSKAPNIVNNETVKCEKDLDMLPDEENNKNSSMVSSNSNTCKHDQGSSNIGGDGITNTEKSKNSGILPGVQNNIDRCIRQKGPRIAKVVRRINSQVEPLDYGAVCSGNSWSNSRAIFPKGFKSRVRYISVLDPTNMCYYISQILDAGKDGPLFMVSLEHCSTEVFIHTSPLKCWDMVRERVNHEIAKQLKLGTKKLLPLQPPGSLDGIEMFGLSTPAILQVIQKMDSDRICTDYWEHLPMSNYPQSQPEKNTTVPKTEIQNDHNGLESNLSGLLKKANLEELQALRSVLNGGTSPDRTVVSKLLHQEINKRRR